VQLHQLTPNAFAQLSKCFWVVLSFGGVPTSDGFTKHYKLHYQPNNVENDEGVMFLQFGYINFYARRCQGSEARLNQAVKNKWATGWTQAWFYYKVPAHVCPQGSKSVHVLRSHLCTLDFWMESPIDCPYDDLGDAAFIKTAVLSEVKTWWRNT
jgi:hypothetical protein